MGAALAAIAIGMAGMGAAIAYAFTSDEVIAISWAFGAGNIAVIAYAAVAHINRQ
jgi:hypothetical protein